MDIGDNTTPEERKYPHLAPPWKPGQSGNPGGRPRGLALVVRNATKEGAEIVQFWLDVMRALPEGDYSKASLLERLKASELLAMRGFGKVETLVVDEEREKVKHEVEIVRKAVS